MKLLVTREQSIPDEVKLARYAKSPELGPRILFFSGGSALKDLSRVMIKYTHNSIHIITTFDSGGSSAKLRIAFDMPAIGDMRARLMALADQSFQGNPAVYSLFAYRLPKIKAHKRLVAELMEMASGRHRLVVGIPDPMRKIVRHHLKLFLEFMPPDMDLSGASIGNLVLTAGYLENRRHLDPIIYIYSRLAQVRGTVRPVLNKKLHLCARLENGDVLVGQHLISAKEAPKITSPIREVWLSEDQETAAKATVQVRQKVSDLIMSAEMICYPMGSFYSSIIANFLPGGVSDAIAGRHCPKIYIPSTGRDPECHGIDLGSQIDTVLGYLQQGAKGKRHPSEFLKFVLMDSANKHYAGAPDEKRLKKLGIEIIRTTLVTRQSAPHIDSGLLSRTLMSVS